MSTLIWSSSASVTISTVGLAAAGTSVLPLQLNITNAAALFAGAATNAADIRITMAGSATLLPYWVESYDAANKLALLWVRLPPLPANGTATLDLQWSNPAANSPLSSFDPTFSRPAADSSTLGLWLLEDKGVTSSVDVSGNNRPLVLHGTTSWEQGAGGAWNGKIAGPTFSSGSALTLDGSTGYATVDGLLDVYPMQGSISFWVKFNSTAGPQRLIQKLNVPGGGQFEIIYNDGGNGVIEVFTYRHAVGYSPMPGLTPPVAGRWYLVTANWDWSVAGPASNVELWLDDVVERTGFMFIPDNGGSKPFAVGAYIGNDTPVHNANATFWGLEVRSAKMTQADIVAKLQMRPRSPVTTTYERLVRNPSNPILTINNSVGDQNSLQEFCGVHDPIDNILRGYCHNGWAGPCEIILWTSPVTDGLTWTRVGPVLGNGLGGESGTDVGRWHIPVKIDGTPITGPAGEWYAFYDTNVQLANNTALGICLAISTDRGQTWSRYGKLIADNLTGWNARLCGPAVTYNPDDATWYMLAQGLSDGTPIWRYGLYTAPSPQGPWTPYANNPLTSLQLGDGMYGGYQLFRHHGRFMTVYHTSRENVTPTQGRLAYSDDAKHWQIDPRGSILQMAGDIVGQDQVADLWILPLAGKTIVYFSVDNNPTQSANIFAATFVGTLDQLITPSPSLSIGTATTISTAADIATAVRANLDANILGVNTVRIGGQGSADWFENNPPKVNVALFNGNENAADQLAQFAAGLADSTDPDTVGTFLSVAAANGSVDSNVIAIIGGDPSDAFTDAATNAIQNYGAAKPGDAMNVNAAGVLAVQAGIINESDGQQVLSAIVNKVNATDVNLAGLSVGAITTNIRANLDASPVMVSLTPAYDAAKIAAPTTTAITTTIRQNLDATPVIVSLTPSYDAAKTAASHTTAEAARLAAVAASTAINSIDIPSPATVAEATRVLVERGDGPLVATEEAADGAKQAVMALVFPDASEVATAVRANLDADPISVSLDGGQPGGVTVTLAPTNGTSTTQTQPDGEITIYQNTPGIIALEVNDSNGPVTLGAGPTFKVYRDTFPSAQTIFQAVASVSGNVASVPYTTSNTANSGRLRYELRATAGDVLATGLFTIRAVA